MRAYVDPLWVGAVNGAAVYWADGSAYRRGPYLFGTDAFGTVTSAVANGGSEIWLAPGAHSGTALDAGCVVVGCGAGVTFYGSGSAGVGLTLAPGLTPGDYWRFERLTLAGWNVARAVVLVSGGSAAFVRCGFGSRITEFGAVLDSDRPSVEAAGPDAAAVCVACKGTAPVATNGGGLGVYREPLTTPGGSMTPEAGKLRGGYVLEAPAERRLGTGERGSRERVWIPVAEFAAEQSPVSAREGAVARVVVENSTHQLRTRGGLPAAMRMRVRYRDQLWEVTDVRHWTGRQNDTFLGLSEARPEGVQR
jgi:hypothetical protein